MGKVFWGWRQVKISNNRFVGRVVQFGSVPPHDDNHADLLATLGNATRTYACPGPHAIFSISINHEDP